MWAKINALWSEIGCPLLKPWQWAKRSGTTVRDKGRIKGGVFWILFTLTWKLFDHIYRQRKGSEKQEKFKIWGMDFFLKRRFYCHLPHQALSVLNRLLLHYLLILPNEHCNYAHFTEREMECWKILSEMFKVTQLQWQSREWVDFFLTPKSMLLTIFCLFL